MTSENKEQYSIHSISKQHPQAHTHRHTADQSQICKNNIWSGSGSAVKVSWCVFSLGFYLLWFHSFTQTEKTSILWTLTVVQRVCNSPAKFPTLHCFCYDVEAGRSHWEHERGAPIKKLINVTNIMCWCIRVPERLEEQLLLRFKAAEMWAPKVS